MVEKRFSNVIRKSSEDEQRRLLQVGRLRGRGSLEEEREKLGPRVLREEERGELGYGVADLLRDGLGGVGLERAEEVGLERGLTSGGEEGPERHRRGGGRVGGGRRGQELAKEDRGHGAEFRGGGRRRERRREAQREGLRVGAAEAVEGGLGGGAVGVGGRHERGEQRVERRRVATQQRGGRGLVFGGRHRIGCGPSRRRRG